MNCAKLGLIGRAILVSCVAVLCCNNSWASDIQDCAKLWAKGSPLAGHSTYPCYLFAEVPGHTPPTRIYWSAALGTSVSALSPQNAAALALIQLAVADSQSVYSAFGYSSPAAVLYTGTPSARKRPAETPTGFSSSGEPVPVLVYTDLLQDSAAYQKQTIAHEMFHVFQASMHSGLTPFPEEDWWMEGTADFFSNLVYPATNREWEDVQAYDQDQPLYAQPSPYSTTGFFQSFGSSWLGPKGIVSLIQDMPQARGAGATDQWAKLAAFPSMEVHFDNFAKAYTLSKIADTAGGNLPTHFVEPNAKAVPDSGLSETLTPEPFLVETHRYALAGGKMWKLTGKSTDYKLKSSYMRSGQDKDWQMLFSGYPVTLDLSCDQDPRQIDLLVDSATGPGTAKSGMDISFEQQTKECSCKPGGDLPEGLLGKWLLRDSSLKDFLASALSSVGTVDQVSGKMTATIEKNHAFTYQLDHVTLDYHRADGTLVHMVMDGAGTQATAEAKDLTQMCLRQISTSAHAVITVTMPGHAPITMDQPLGQMWEAGAAYPLSMTPATLTAYRTFQGKQVPIVFDRI